MKTLHIWPENPRACDGEVSLRAVFDGFDSGKKTVEIAVQQSALPRIPSRSDHFALAALFPAMRAFETCVIHGKVSRSLLANLCELNAIWHVWRPETYRLVEWKADQIVEASVSSPVRKGHLFAFSGGVDACATLLRHSDARLGWRKLPIGAAVIVHGFDIPFTDQAGFNRAFDKAKRIASNVGVPHFGVRTNIRDLPTNWEDSFAANVASVLHLFNEVYEGGVFASCEPYRFPILPWGSNPVSNPFQGASNFPVRTDGAELTRLEKMFLHGS